MQREGLSDPAAFRDSQARSAHCELREAAATSDTPPAAAAPLGEPLARAAAWFCLRTRSRFEFAVRDALRAAGLTEWLPTVDVTTRWTDRIATTTRPLFEGYIFAQLTAADRAAARQTRGVVQILGQGDGEAIANEVMEDLKRLVASAAPVARGPYVAGAAVRVKSGPFAGVSGIVTRVKGATLLSIPVAILGRSVSVQIDAADVEKTDS